MRKWIAVLSIAAVASFTVGLDAQSVPRNLQKGTATSAVQPAGNASSSTAAALPSFETRGGTIDPALISPTGVRTSGSDEDLLRPRGTRTAPSIVAFGPPCTIPACTGTDENEPCGDATNNGCAADFCDASAFIAASAGGTFCGTSFADGDLRDLDYYQIDSTSVQTLSLTLNSEFASNLILLESTGGPANCDGLLALDTVDGGGCAPVTIERTLVAGTTYYVVVTTGDAAGPIFNGIPCGANNAYQLDIGLVSADCGACAGGAAEIEICGTDTNGGCNAATPGPNTFESIIPGIPTCGTLRTFIDPTTLLGNRDIDWYNVSVLAAGVGAIDITVELTGEAPTTAFIIQDTGGFADCGTTGGLLLAGDPIFSSSCSLEVGTFTVNAGGTYYLFVSTGDEFGGLFDGVGDCTDPANDYSVTVVSNPAVCPTFCALTGGGVPEGEPCPANPFDDDNFNGGCNSATTPPTFSSITPGTSIAATTWADSGTRDTDWFKFDVAAAGSPVSLEFTVTSQVDVAVFVLANETDPGAFDLLQCGGMAPTYDFLAVQDIVGNCGPATVNVTLNPNAGFGFSDYVIVVVPGTSTVGVFSGIPCVCDASYELDITPLGGPPCTFPAGLCDTDCTSGDLVFNLDAPVAYDDVEIVIDDNDGNNVGTINTGPLPAGPFTNTFTPPADGVYQVTINATCAGGAMAPAAVCTAAVWTYNGQTDIIFDGDPDGCIDGAQALEDALVANGRSVLVIDNGFTFINDYACLGDADNVWVAFGSFPNNFAMAPDEGTRLATGVLGGEFNVYLEGGDVWGFDAPTAYFDVDGVEGTALDGTLILDGDDSLLAMTGSANSAIDTSPFGTVAYNQDNRNPSFFGGDDFTDQLLSSTTDLPAGRLYEQIWSQDGLGYGVAVAGGVPADFEGKVISASFEFGGFGGDQNALMADYVGFFEGPSLGQGFVRTNCNGGAATDISDAIFLLGILFPPAAGPNVPECEQACDANDDNALNIADAVFILSVLFPPVAGAPTVLPPLVCGVDPTPLVPAPPMAGALTCDSFYGGMPGGCP